MTETKPLVFIVDEDPAICSAVGDVLQSEGLSSRCFGSARAFLDSSPFDGPACVVADMMLPGTNGLELQIEIAARSVPLPIIFISGRRDIRATVRAIKAGAVEFLPKPLHVQDLMNAVRQALEIARRARNARYANQALSGRYHSLTPREHQVLDCVMRGLLNKQTAHDLGISEITVKIHRSHVMQKMSARTLVELIRMVEHLRPGWINPGP